MVVSINAMAHADDNGATGDRLSAPVLETNQALIEELRKSPTLDIDNIPAVFSYVLASLPAEVRVYPTENYYYFRFIHDGVEYAGNLRLAATDRDNGIIHFAYFRAANASSANGEMHYMPMSAEVGVNVEKLDDLSYMVRYGDIAVTFALNDLSGVRPPDAVLGSDEDYLGPVFDESGLRMFLVFNRKAKIFHYVLDETVDVLDELQVSAKHERILIGQRTGFAFFVDPYLDRKILIGVHADNVRANNYYDGPFDQLPDNFIEGDSLKTAIEAADPSVRGKIDRFGYLQGRDSRYLIGPYIQYTATSDLLPLVQCATGPGVGRRTYARCLSVHGGGEGRGGN